MSDAVPTPIDPDDVEIQVRHRRRPHVPWFKDEQVFGGRGPQTRTAVRVLIIAMVVALGVVAWAASVALDASSRVSTEMTINHQHRLHDEAVLRDELHRLQGAVIDTQQANRDLACSVRLFYQHQPSDHRPSSGFLQFLNNRYDCAAFHPRNP